jgi:predicted cobalt transporter CbtA
LLVLPHIAGAPMPRHPDPSAVQALASLPQQFVVAIAIVNLVLWLALGLACGVVFNRWCTTAPSSDGRR